MIIVKVVFWLCLESKYLQRFNLTQNVGNKTKSDILQIWFKEVNLCISAGEKYLTTALAHTNEIWVLAYVQHIKLS